MPLNLDHFLNIAANRTTSEIYITGQDQEAARTRGTLKSWFVSIFKGDQTRNQRTETANAFIAALRDKVAAKTNGLAGARDEIRNQYNEDTGQIVDSLRNILADQLNGQRALTADVIRIATSFVDSTLAQADAEKDSLLASMNREEALTHLETTALQFYGRESLEDIKLSDHAAKAKTDATRTAQEDAMAARGIRVVSRAPQAPAPDAMVKLLRSYLAGAPKQMSFAETDAVLKNLRTQITEIKDTCSVTIPLFEKLSKGETVNPNQWTNDIEPGSDDAKAYLNAFKTLKEEYLAPMLTLEYFLRADMAEMKREAFLDSKALRLNNGNDVTSERSIREILDDFQSGKQLSEADITFINNAGNSKDLNQVNQMRPGYQLFSGGGNPGALMTGVLESVSSVPNSIWQGITDVKAPDPKTIVYSPSEPNPWALAVQQKLIARGDDMLDFSNAQKGLANLFEQVVKSDGNINEARRLQNSSAPVAKARAKQWDPKFAAVNQKTLERENVTNDLEHRFSADNFARGVNRSLNVDPRALPARGHKVPGKEYTRGYDDDIDSGVREAASPRNPVQRPAWQPPKEGEAPKSILKKPLSDYQKTMNEVQRLTNQYAFESDFIQSYAQEQNINLAKFTPAHRELFETILFHQAKASATDYPRQFGEAVVIKSSKNILKHLDSLSDADAQASLARFTQLRNAGEAVLASIVDGDIQGLSDKRQAVGQAVINYIDQVNSDGIWRDLACLKPNEILHGDDLGLVKTAASDIAFSSVDIATQGLVFNEILKTDSPLRAAYKAVGAHDNNPRIDNNNALNAVSIELTQGLNLIVQQIGQNANVSPVAIRDAVNSLTETFRTGKYADLTGSIDDRDVSPQTKVIFDTLVPYIAQREVIVRNTAEGFDSQGSQPI
jgi:hypothetical protein